MISDIIHAIHQGYTALVNAVFPVTSVGGLNNVLNFPADLSIDMESLVRSFGS